MAIEEILARSAQIIVALFGAYLIVLWFVSIVWAYRDIEARSRSVVTQIFSTLLVVLFPFFGIPLYLVLRPKDTLDSAFQKSLEEEYLLQDLEELPLCPNCQHFVEGDFLLCPNCHTQLRDACPSCERLIDLRWSLCPYCGMEHSGRDAIEPVEAPAARWVRPVPVVGGGERTIVPPQPQLAPDVATPARPAAATVGQLVARRRELATEPGRLTVVGGRAYRAAAASGGNGQPRRGRFLRPADGDDAATTTIAVPAVESPDGPEPTMRADGD